MMNEETQCKHLVKGGGEGGVLRRYVTRECWDIGTAC